MVVIELARSIYKQLEDLDWFACCGSPDLPKLSFSVARVLDPEVAADSMSSAVWADAKTHAQGELTGYLARRDYQIYGTHWNKLAKETQSLDETIGASVERSLLVHRLKVEWAPLILTDIGRAALELAFRKRFRLTPVFFEQLLDVYLAGRLPCGWQGDIDRWPEGRLMVH
jgi:hypothetical protein